MRNPPSHLHPKSRFTASLFATTVFASFFVVLLPHILPCPAPRNSYLDDGSSISTSPNGRRRRRKVIVEADGERDGEGEQVVVEQSREDGNANGRVIGEGKGRRETNKRACPIPKPTGLVGEILGFKTESGTEREVEEVEKICPIPRTPKPSEMLGFKRVVSKGHVAQEVGRRRRNENGSEDGESVGVP